MNYLSSGRNQRPKGFNVKQAFQFAFLLAVCIWLLYQIKHSHDERKVYGASIQNKLSEEHGAIRLGRKGNAGWSSSGGESDSEDRDVVGEGEKREDGGAGDDELDRNIEENAEEVSYKKYNDYGHGNVASHGEKEDEKEHEGQYEELQSNEDNISDTHGHHSAEGSMRDRDEEGDEKDTQTQVKEPQNPEKNHTSTLIQDKYLEFKENDEDKGRTKIEEKIAVQPGGMLNVTIPGQSDMEDGVPGFHDENGVPQDVNDIIESMPKDSRDQENILSRETISSSNNQSRIIESMPTKGEEVESKEGSNTADADAETESKGTLEDSRNDKNADVKIDLETSAASSTNHTSETVQQKLKVLEDSHSVSSQQEHGEVTDISMFPQAE